MLRLNQLTTCVEVIAERPRTIGVAEANAENGVPLRVFVRQDEYADLYEDAILRAQRVPELAIPVVLPEQKRLLRRLVREFITRARARLSEGRTLRSYLTRGAVVVEPSVDATTKTT